MIDKVAISQCVRDAFPKDYEGLYSEDEMVASGAIPVNFREVKGNDGGDSQVVEVSDADPVISQEQRQALFKAAQKQFGKEEGNAVVKKIIESMGLESTTGMTESQYVEATERLMKMVDDRKAAIASEETATDEAGE